MRWVTVLALLCAAAPAQGQPTVRVTSGGKTTPLSEDGKTQRYHLLTAGQSFRFELSGPSKLKLLLRPKIDLSAPVTTLALEVVRDLTERRAEVLDLGPDVAEGARQKMQTYIAPPRRIALDVPGGPHAYEVKVALGAAYVRLVQEEIRFEEGLVEGKRGEGSGEELELSPIGGEPDIAPLGEEGAETAKTTGGEKMEGAAPKAVAAAGEGAPAGAPGGAATAAAPNPAPGGYRTLEAKKDEEQKKAAAEARGAEGTAAPAEEPRFRLVPSVGFGFTMEGELRENTPSFSLGGTFEWRFRPDLVFGARAAAQIYGRSYRLNRLDPSGGEIASVDLDEQKIDLDAFASYEVLHWLQPRLVEFFRRFTFWVEGGPSARFFANELLPSNFFGVQVGARTTFRINEQLQLEAAAGHIYNWFPDLASLSFFGAPRAATVLRGALAIAFPPSSQLRLGYSGEIYAQEFSYRSYHALSFLFDVAF